MGEDTKAFGEDLYSRMQSKGLSKYQVDKVLALQRLDLEVAELGNKGLLGEAQLLEISKINSVARQKQLAELAVEKSLPASWVKELTKLIRNAEKARNDAEANKYWDFFFEIKEMTEKEGPTREILRLIKNFSIEKAIAKGSATAEEGGDRRVVSFDRMSLVAGRGVDVGTVNICAAARMMGAGDTAYNIQRNAFLDVRSDTFTRKMLMKLGIDYIVQGEKGYVLGDPAFELANIFEKPTRRPMKDGMISPLEPEALLIVSLLLAELLGHPQSAGEVCAFSVPADPVDVERNVIYHRGALETILRKIGYTPKPMIEGHAVIFGELQKEDYTGVGISCGGGMFNICVAYKSVPALTFSTSRGGDWIDNNVSTAIGMPSSLVCAVKEGGVDLMNPKDRVQDAIVIYYRNLIQYTLETIRAKFESAQNMPSFSQPIDVVCAGGTSLIEGFIDVFREEFDKVNFPIDVRQIRMARDPLRTVAAGCMQAAIEEMNALSDMGPILSPAAARRADATVTGKSGNESGTRSRRAPSPGPDTQIRRGGASKVAASAKPAAATATKERETEARQKAPAAKRQETAVNKKVPPPPPAPESVLEELEEIEELQEVEELSADPEPPKTPPLQDSDADDIPLIS